MRPITGHYEQHWNAAQIETHGMERWFHGDLERDLSQPFNRMLLRRLAPWYQDGARLCYERIFDCAKSENRSDRGHPDPTPDGA